MLEYCLPKDFGPAIFLPSITNCVPAAMKQDLSSATQNACQFQICAHSLRVCPQSETTDTACDERYATRLGEASREGLFSVRCEQQILNRRQKRSCLIITRRNCAI